MVDELLCFANRYKPVAEFLGAAATPILGAMVAWIAYQQYRTNQRREHRESREAKLGVYRKFKRFLHSATQQVSSSKELLEELDSALAEADFLFPKDLTDWLAEVRAQSGVYYRNAEAARMIWSNAKPVSFDDDKPVWHPDDEERAYPYEQRESMAQDALKNYYEELPTRFAPYIEKLKAM